MLKPFLLALCCAGCVLALNPQEPHSASATDRDSDSGEVYAVVVNWRIGHPGEGPKAKQLVISDTTTQYSCLGEKPEECAGKVKELLARVFGEDLEASVLNDYIEQNKERESLTRSIPTDLPKFWLSDVDEERLFKSKKHDGWKTFYGKYPGAGGIMAFSRVGFNEKRDRALLYSTIGCGWLCGTGHYHLLKKESGKWALVKNNMAWIS